MQFTHEQAIDIVQALAQAGYAIGYKDDSGGTFSSDFHELAGHKAVDVIAGLEIKSMEQQLTELLKDCPDANNIYNRIREISKEGKQ